MSAGHATQFYIDGEWQDRSGSPLLAVVDPASEAVIGHVAAGGSGDVDLAVAAARRAFESFSRTSVEGRLALLGRILDLLELRGGSILAHCDVARRSQCVDIAPSSRLALGQNRLRHGAST